MFFRFFSFRESRLFCQFTKQLYNRLGRIRGFACRHAVTILFALGIQLTDRRKKAFTLKRDADSEFLLKYMQEGKKKNASIKSESYMNDLRILQGLDSLGKANAAILDDVAYYDYRFSATAKGKDVTMQFRDAYISITPDGRVISMTAERRDLHKSAGRVIPGYYELVKGSDEEEDFEVIL